MANQQRIEALAQISQNLNDAAFRLIKVQTAYTELGDFEEARKLDSVLDSIYRMREAARKSRQELEGVIEV